MMIVYHGRDANCRVRDVGAFTLEEFMNRYCIVQVNNQNRASDTNSWVFIRIYLITAQQGIEIIEPTIRHLMN